MALNVAMLLVGAICRVAGSGGEAGWVCAPITVGWAEIGGGCAWSRGTIVVGWAWLGGWRPRSRGTIDFGFEWLRGAGMGGLVVGEAAV